MKTKMLQLVFLLSVLLAPLSFNAQIHMKGKVDIDMNKGLIGCELRLSNIPELTDYRIWINKGMNIKYFKNSDAELIQYDGFYSGKINGEAIEYTFVQDSLAHIPNEFNVTYKGAFPIYQNEFGPFDYKGAIAFNGETLRATEQTKWYPVIYNAKTDRILNSYSYELEVHIIGGNTVFINGTKPQKGEDLHFVSKKAHPLLLFAGSYDFVESNGDYIINTNVSKETSKKVFDNIEIIKSSLSKNLKLKFTDNIYLINHRAVNKRPKGSSWGFNTYPTFAFTGLDFNKILNEKGGFSNDINRYFGHEFAHNYFGNNVMSGKLGWFWLESFAEYLSYNIAEDLCGMDFLKQVLLGQLKYIKDDSFVPLAHVEKRSDINEKYRYIVGPFILKCFEDRFGRDKTNLTLQSLLKVSTTETLTLNQWKKSAVQGGVSEKDFETFETDFLVNEDFLQNVKDEILRNYSNNK
nr:hypothetical protein [Allomuricauda sp.]